MRSVPAGSFDRLSRPDALWAAYHTTRRGKRRQPAMARFDLDADRRIFTLARDLERGAYRPGRFRVKVIHEPKARLIAAPPIIDRIVHHALLTEIGPTYERGFIDQSYACCTGRGVHRAIIRHLGYTRRHRHRLSLDVRRYFPSVDHTILLDLIARRLRDRRTIDLVEQTIVAGGEVYRSRAATALLGPPRPGAGLAIGSWFSQWSAALYLDGLDHVVKRTLKVPGYLRYSDDMALFADERQHLLEARAAVEEWLSTHRGLELNPKTGAVVPTTQPCVFLGWRISRAGLAPSGKAWRRMRRRLREADSHGPDALARTVAAYQGWMSF